LEATAGDVPMAGLCRAFGISRVTGYKWLDRYGSGGVAALSDRSRARHTQPHAYPASIRELVIQARMEHPTWGGKKLRPWLAKRHPRVELPSVTTMETILREAKLVRRRRRSRRLEGPVGVRGGDDRPNGVWAVDFKGQFRLGDGSYCYPLTATDSCSRYLLTCTALRCTKFDPAWTVFDQLFAEYGVPERIRSDNGVPFASVGVGRLSRLSVYWMSLGIEVERTRPGKPQDNGRHERMHRTLKEDTTRPPAGTRRGQQRRFNRFRMTYNEERPHEALNMRCPAEFYEPSSRPYEVVEFQYPGHWEQRTVRNRGAIKWKDQEVFLSEALSGHHVGLVEIDDGVWQVCFRNLPLGRLIDRHAKPTFERIRPRETV
jgi:transposase InsO family protein